MPDKTGIERQSRFQRVLPALALMLLAPLVAEVLPGATRISSMFVLPIEVIIWGGGAVMIRFAVRRLGLGWRNMLLLAIALSVAEECLIQQTSLAPLVIQIKGVEYARAFGVNYVYFLWALIYETLFVVFIPVGLAELIFHRRREQPWLNTAGVAIIALLFLPACFLAWFSWTQIARTQVFHLEPYTPPFSYMMIAVAAIIVMIGLALGSLRDSIARRSKPLKPPHPIFMFVLSGLATVVIFGLMLLAFGIYPPFPPAFAVTIGLMLVALLVAFVPSFYAHETWGTWHEIGILYGAIFTNMAIFFIAFIGSTPVDFYGKVIMNVIAVTLLSWLAMRLWVSPPARKQSIASSAKIGA